MMFALMAAYFNLWERRKAPRMARGDIKRFGMRLPLEMRIDRMWAARDNQQHGMNLERRRHYLAKLEELDG
jgi:hypothetical protein